MKRRKLTTLRKFTKIKPCEQRIDMNSIPVNNIVFKNNEPDDIKKMFYVGNFQSFYRIDELANQSLKNIMPDSLKNLAENVRIRIPTSSILLIENLKSFSESISKFVIPEFKLSDTLMESFKIIQDEYSGEKLEHKVKLVEKWADYGWVLYPELSIPDIFNCPDTQLEADELVMSIFSEEDMRKSLNEIRSNEFVKDDIIDDILLLYSHGSFSSCILVTITLIEGILLNYMKYEKKLNESLNINNKGYKKTQLACLEEYEKMFTTYLNSKNIGRLIEGIFENNTGKDWMNEPDYVLRDYFSHGMSNRNWEKTDAVKVILLLIEFSDYVEMRLRSLRKR